MLDYAFGVWAGCNYPETLYQDGCIRFVRSVKPDGMACPACGGKDIAGQGQQCRDLQTGPIGLKPVFLVTEGLQCQCAACGR